MACFLKNLKSKYAGNLLLPRSNFVKTAATMRILSSTLLSLTRELKFLGICSFSNNLRPYSINCSKMYKVVERGSCFTTDYRIFFEKDGGFISPLHDIPLFSDPSQNLYNMVVEIPRWTNAKMEICMSETLNPIKQDVKKGNVRFVANCFPHHGYIWNYGAIPQTWENPQHLDDSTGCKGDNDPIDVLEIGSRVAKRGDILSVKILGCLALIDEGETDWKILAIDSQDPLANEVNDVADIEKHFPGLLKATVEWFKIYKIPDGKPENQFAFKGEAKNKEFATKIVGEVHEFWKSLVKGDTANGSIACSNVTVDGSAYTISSDDATAAVNTTPELGSPASIPSSVDKWHHITLART